MIEFEVLLMLLSYNIIYRNNDIIITNTKMIDDC